MSVLPTMRSAPDARRTWRPRPAILAVYSPANGSFVRRSEYSGHVGASSMRHPAAAAPASRHARTRSLSGWAENDEPPANRVGDGSGGEGRPEAGGGDDVVPARVADPRKGVVLAEHRDGGPVTAAATSGEGGLEAVRAALDVEVSRLERRRQGVGGRPLFEQELRAGMDGVGDVDQGAGTAIDLGGDPSFGVFQVHGARLSHDRFSDFPSCCLTFPSSADRRRGPGRPPPGRAWR